MEELTTKEAAEPLGKGVRAVQGLIARGQFPVREFGRDCVMDAKDLKQVEDLKRGPKPKKGPRKEADGNQDGS